jgi:hypothetical protein
VPPPPPTEPELHALIIERWKKMTLTERSLSLNALNSPAWSWQFEEERAIELARVGGRAYGLLKKIGHHAWWLGCDVDGTL